MRRLAFYTSSVIVVVSIVATTWSVLTYSKPTPLCPQCRAPDAILGVKYDHATIYTCRSCGINFYGPGRRDIAWMAALEYWLTEEPPVQ